MFTFTHYDLANGSRVTFATDPAKVDAYSTRIRETWTLDSEALLAANLLRKGDTFIDCGANVGAFTIPVRVLSGARGVSVEALPSNVAILKAALAANGIDDMEVCHAAVFDEESEVSMTGDSAYGAVSTEGTIKVRALPLDRIAENYSLEDIKLLKVDVEGSELKAFHGGKRVLEKRPFVIFEANGPHCLANGYMPQDLLAVLEGYGYSLHLILGHTLAPRHSTQFQPFGNCNYLAMVGNSAPEGYAIRELTDDQERAGVTHTFTNMKPQYAEFMREQAKRFQSPV